MQSKEGEGAREGREPKFPIPVCGKAAPVLFKTAPSLRTSGMKLRGRERRGQNSRAASPLQEHLVLPAVGEAGSAHAEVLHQPQVLHLVPDQDLVKPLWQGTDMDRHISAQGSVQLWLYLTGLSLNSK